MSLPNNTNEYVTSAVKALPSVAVTGAAAGGVSLQDWVLIATLVYTVLQAAHLIYKFFKDRRNGG